MMRKAILIGLAMLCRAALAYDLLQGGALADVRFHVCDEQGAPVEGVEATLCFQKTFTKATVVTCKTDREGLCSARELSIGESFGQYIGLSMKCWFNPNDNDANLEDAKSR